MLEATPLRPDLAKYVQRSEKCEGQHHMFIAGKVGVPAEGTYHIFTICTACDYANVHSFRIASPNQPQFIEENDKG